MSDEPQRVEFTDLIDIEPDTDFLEAYLKRKREIFEDVQHLELRDIIDPGELSKTSPIAERCAQLADIAMVVIVINGKKELTDGNLFRSLFDVDLDKYFFQLTSIRMEKQILAIPKIIAKIKMNPDLFITHKSREPEETITDQAIILTKLDLQILLYLNEQDCSCFQTDIAAGVDRTRDTIRKSLDKLRELELTIRPGGPRKGEAITPAGRQHIKGKQPPIN